MTTKPHRIEAPPALTVHGHLRRLLGRCLSTKITDSTSASFAISAGTTGLNTPPEAPVDDFVRPKWLLRIRLAGQNPRQEGSAGSFARPARRQRSRMRNPAASGTRD